MLSTDIVPYCVAPWVNLHVDTVENVKPCCRGAGVYTQIENIDRYANGYHHGLEDVKSKLRRGLVPSACTDCQEREWYSEFSDRRYTIETNPSLELRSIDLRWSNTCQLTCLYCGSDSSSAWASLNKIDGNIKQSRISKRQNLLKLIDSNNHSIKRISLLGGEPLLIKENLEVLDMLNPDIQVDIFTGLNVDLNHNAIFHRLIKMPNVQWSISMENVGQRFEFVRRNAVWTRQLENLTLLRSISCSRFTPVFQSQFSAHSATCLVDLYALASDIGFKIHWDWMVAPPELDFTYFPDQYKKLSLEQFAQIKNFKHVDGHLPVIDHIVEKLEKSLGQGSPEAIDRCVDWHQQREKKYFQNRYDFLSLWPEYGYMP